MFFYGVPIAKTSMFSINWVHGGIRTTSKSRFLTTFSQKGCQNRTCEHTLRAPNSRFLALNVRIRGKNQ